MIFPCFAIFIVFIIWLTYERKKHEKTTIKSEEEFWAREAEANLVRRKPLDDLDYIVVPFDALPLQTDLENDKISDAIRIIQTFQDKKAVNLTGLTNTDLKLEYGAPNIRILTEYDQNYTLLIRTLNQWGANLNQDGFEAEARTVYEFAASIRTDISQTYKELSQIYVAHNLTEQLLTLRETADTISSLMRDSILKDLDEKIARCE